MLIRRRPLLYVVGLLIPSVFLMLVDVTSFYLPLDSRTRIVFKVSILLGYTLFRVNITEELPSTAGATPLIGAHRRRLCRSLEDAASVFIGPSIFFPSQASSSWCAWLC